MVVVVLLMVIAVIGAVAVVILGQSLAYRVCGIGVSHSPPAHNKALTEHE